MIIIILKYRVKSCACNYILVYPVWLYAWGISRVVSTAAINTHKDATRAPVLPANLILQRTVTHVATPMIVVARFSRTCKPKICTM